MSYYRLTNDLFDNLSSLWKSVTCTLACCITNTCQTPFNSSWNAYSACLLQSIRFNKYISTIMNRNKSRYKVLQELQTMASGPNANTTTVTWYQSITAEGPGDKKDGNGCKGLDDHYYLWDERTTKTKTKKGGTGPWAFECRWRWDRGRRCLLRMRLLLKRRPMGRMEWINMSFVRWMSFVPLRRRIICWSTPVPAAYNTKKQSFRCAC